MTLEERFWNKVDADGPCWLWTASCQSAGYGQFVINGRPQVAHRVAWELLVGPIPPRMQLDHLCRVPRCVNPDHLRVVTMQANIAASPISALGKTHCKNGHRFDEANTLTGKGRRQCRTCHREREARRHQRRRVP